MSDDCVPGPSRIEYIEVYFHEKTGFGWTARFLPLTGNNPDMLLLERDEAGAIIRESGWRLASPMELQDGIRS